MKQKYILLTRSIAISLAWNPFVQKSKTKTASLLVVLFMLFGFSDAFGQVTINTASGSINSCTYPTNYVGLGDIFLEENQNGNFNIILQNFDYTLIITAPTNFEFRPGTGSVSFRGTGDITAASINVTATTITVTYRSSDGNRTNNDDRLTISGIEFRGITAPSTGNMTRTALGGGTGTISGAAGGSIYGSLTSTNNPLPANGGGAATVCVGSATPAFTNATGGGTWSIIPGTGTATVTVGGVVTGTSAGTVTVRYTVNGCIANSALTVNPTPAAIGGGAATVCTGASTPAFTNAVGGGTWSVISGTGTASITGGGVLTGTTAGTVTVRYTLPAGCFVNSAVVTIQQTPGAIAGGSATVCNGASTPAFTNPNGGGTWSVLNGTGTATITGGGVLTGTSPGTVTVRYTIGSCTPATFNVTVIASPAAIGGGAATVCVGGTTPAFTNAVGGGTWSITNGTGSATISGGIVTGVTTGTATVVYTIGTCSVSTPITVISTPTISANPANASTNTGGTANFSVTALNGPTSYTWQVSTNGGGSWTTVTNGGVYSGATTATLTITGATLGMNGYLYQVSATNACGTSAFSTSASLTVSNLVLVTGLGTNSVTCGDNTILRDHADLGNYTMNRNDWSVINVTSTAVVNINGTYNTENGFDFIRIYDGSGIGGTLLAQYTGVGTINYTSNPGQTITIRFQSDNIIASSGFDLNVTYTGNCNIPCVTPTALPTALTLSATGTVISGAFTHAVPQPDNYLVVISTNPVAPTPANGTSYAIGATVGAGYTVIANGSGNAFSATGLANSTTYYIYVFSFNRLCIGGPLYLGNLNGNATTTTTDPYCVPTSGVSTRYIENVFTVGAITNLNNMLTGRAPSGYADYTTSTPVTQIPGGGVAIDYLLRVSRQYIEMWVDWNNDGTFADPAEMVYNSGGILTIEGTGGFVVPPAQPLGTYRIRIKTREDSPNIDPCTNYTTGETEDYRLVVVADCAAKPNALYDGQRCDVGTVILGVQGTPGITEFRFYDSLYGGTLIGTQAAVPGITNWTTPFLTNTTKYYVTAFNGSCESWYRQEIIAKINPTANIVVTPSVPNVCGENNVVQIDAGGDVVINYLVDEDFGDGTIGLGTMVLFNVAGQADANTQWTGRTSPYVPVGSVWKPALTSRAIGDGFALANSDFTAPNPKDSQLRTAVLDASAYSDLTLSFRHHFSYYPGEPVQFGYVDVSIDGGLTWPTTLATYTSNQGFAGQFTPVNVNLNAFAGQPNLMVRFRYYLAGGSAWCNGWAIDDVQIFGTRPLNTTFTWTGGTVNAFIDPACTIPYVAQSVSTVYVRPTPLQLASPSWSFTANATLGNGCPISEFITITNSTKLWIGGTSSDWYNPNNWSPAGVPDANTCVFVYDGTFDADINNISNDAFARFVTVRPSGLLTIHPNNDLTITDNLTVDAGGTVNIENTGSLIQVNNVANSGIISMKRNALIKALDYVYWSSPVASFASNAISPATPTSVIWKWEPTTATAYASQFGNWVNGVETMSLGRGYIVRSPNGWPSSVTTFTANFVGVPNNGDITRPITRSTYTGANYTGPTSTPVTANDDNWNLLGNPYPSAIDAIAFLSANATHINGYVDLWTHGNAPAAIADPFYQDYQLNYNPNDYLRYNNTGGTQFGFDGKIGAGQGFFVLMRDAGSTTENVTFTNAMRSRTHRNDQFFRTSETNEITTEIERHRIWLKMVAPNLVSTDMLVGYVAGATNTLDDSFDAMNRGVKVNYELYSLAENQGLLIQGRSLPFDNNDQIPLGVVVPQNGIYRIAIDAVDGLFTNTTQNIYLEDTTLGITHDLRAAPYSFTANVGRYENRFVLKFTNSTLGNEDFVANNVMVYTNESININATNQTIKSVKVYDLLGRVLGTFDNVDATAFSTKNVAKTQSPLLVEVTLSNGTIVSKKTIY